MALKEGRCPNCASILYLEPKQERGHCLFCDAVFDNSFAFSLAENVGDHVFANVPQPKYEGPNLDPKSVQSKVDFSTLTKAAPVTATKQVEKFVPKSGKIPSLNMSLKQIGLITVVSLVLILAFVVTTLPLTTRRDRERRAIEAEVRSKLGYEGEYGRDFVIEKLNNSSAMMIVKKEMSEKEAMDYFKVYCSARAKAQSISEDKSMNGVSLRVISAKGSFELNQTEGSVKAKALD